MAVNLNSPPEFRIGAGIAILDRNLPSKIERSAEEQTDDTQVSPVAPSDHIFRHRKRLKHRKRKVPLFC